MEADSPASAGAPQPRARGAAGAIGSQLRRIQALTLCQALRLAICVDNSISTLQMEKRRIVTCSNPAFFQPGSDNLLDILKRKWWKYVLLGLADVEANYLIVRAYQYTTLTSVQLLDCFGIPVLMALSWFILRARYRVVHFIAVFVCLLGVGTMVGADIVAGREDNSGSDVLIGDVLVLLGASLYAVSNVCEEYIVKKLSRQEFLGMVGLFGTVISGIQLSALCGLCPLYVLSVQLHAIGD
uniref:Solute carrier family 35 member F2 n=1 Tax=Castor canadensis TaxID=51338 RepID=A0A8C0WJR5_CASCN